MENGARKWWCSMHGYDTLKAMEIKALRNFRHWLFGCAGHIEHEMDRYGVWWLGLRCQHCGRLKGKTLSAIQEESV
jgi:hypothetical protein